MIFTKNTNKTTTVLRPFVWDYPGEPVPEETFTRPPSWSSPNLYQLLPTTTIHSILPVQTACLAIFLHNLCPCPLWSTSWSGALHLIFHTFLHPISVFFSQHMSIPSQLFCCSINIISFIPSFSLNSLLGTLSFYQKHTKHILKYQLDTAEPPFTVKTIGCVYRTYKKVA